MLDSRVSDKMGLRCKGVSLKVLDKVRCKCTKQDDGEFTSACCLDYGMDYAIITGL